MRNGPMLLACGLGQATIWHDELMGIACTGATANVLNDQGAELRRPNPAGWDGGRRTGLRESTGPILEESS